jgi:hypothetical protein
VDTDLKSRGAVVVERFRLQHEETRPVPRDLLAPEWLARLTEPLALAAADTLAPSDDPRDRIIVRLGHVAIEGISCLAQMQAPEGDRARFRRDQMRLLDAEVLGMRSPSDRRVRFAARSLSDWIVATAPLLGPVAGSASAIAQVDDEFPDPRDTAAVLLGEDEDPHHVFRTSVWILTISSATAIDYVAG